MPSTPDFGTARRPIRGVNRGVTRAALASCAGGFIAVACFSAVVNVLTLSGSLYMLQVYDRVIPSRSIPTLVALSVLVVALYALLSVFDWLRQRLLSRIGVALDRVLAGPVFAAILRVPAQGAPANAQLSRDLDTVRGFLSSLGPTTIFDLPWMPLYCAMCFMLHPYLGWSVVAGGIVLILVALATEAMTRQPSAEASRIGAERAGMLEAARRNAEIVAALGMEPRLTDAFSRTTRDYIGAGLQASDVASSLGTLSRFVRYVLQSALLGMGAWLILVDQGSAGVTIAASILGSRALAPIELAVANWRPFLSARQAWQRLGRAFDRLPIEPEIAPDYPKDVLSVKQVFVGAPGSALPVLKDVSFRLTAGQGLAVIGPSASGKSTLARALTGVWPTLRGELRLDGATLSQWPTESRGEIIGYMPQDVQLFAGTVAENIARFDPLKTQETVVKAAKAAGIYEMILGLPAGFDTEIGEGGTILSGGQRQRIALARSLYRDPFLVVLDEPNANIDAEGDAALTAAVLGVRRRGGIVVMIAHRPSALAGIDQVMVLANGQVKALGPKEDVLRVSLAVAPQEQPHHHPHRMVSADASA
ncbi:MAG: type I secretion system permease/ATPase [Ancalomicrobiaceae bacterium]|nr:type I secretion system permease/ATPase [Ancalomicrobiaceae bacterium]